jgi:Raf kinase inhibitor-like YbhB/YbcL family protein
MFKGLVFCKKEIAMSAFSTLLKSLRQAIYQAIILAQPTLAKGILIMQLTSPAFEHEGHIPGKYTCDGANINPPLHIANAPNGTKSLVLIMDDPDVPRHLRAEGIYDHWVVFNIPPETKEILEGHEPMGTHGANTSGGTKYVGPCPPGGEHRYFFKLYALDTHLSLPEKASKKDVEKSMEGHILAKTELMGKYERSR